MAGPAVRWAGGSSATPRHANPDQMIAVFTLWSEAGICNVPAREQPMRCVIRDLATEPKKRELFAKLAEHLTVLASEVERATAIL